MTPRTARATPRRGASDVDASATVIRTGMICKALWGDCPHDHHMHCIPENNTSPRTTRVHRGGANMGRDDGHWVPRMPSNEHREESITTGQRIPLGGTQHRNQAREPRATGAEDRNEEGCAAAVRCTSKEPANTSNPITTHTPSRPLAPTPPSEPPPTSRKANGQMEAPSDATTVPLGMRWHP